MSFSVNFYWIFICEAGMMTPSLIGKTVRKIPKRCKLKLQNFFWKSGIFRENFLFGGESALLLGKKRTFNLKHFFFFLNFLSQIGVFQNSGMNMHLYKAHPCLFYLHLLEI
jgi:hypothetical protein